MGLLNKKIHKAYFKEHGVFKSPKTKHGTETGYRYGCRCELCKNARADMVVNSQKNHRAYFKKHGVFKSPKTKHGTETGYRYGCRCELCKEAMHLAHKKRNKNA